MKHYLLALFLLCFAAAAQAAPLPGTQEKLPVDVTADGMVYDADKNTVVFQGNVEAVRGTFTMWSEKLTLFLKPSGQGRQGASVPGVGGMENNDLDRIVAEKNVRFQNGTQTGSSRKATYFAGPGTLLLEGDPVLHDGDNSIRGNRIRYYVNENRSVVEGSPQQRVHAVFSSNDKKGK